MIGKIFGQLLGNAEADVAVATRGCDEVYEFEDGEWVIINIQENPSLDLVEEDSLENLLIEHPSMSVYQMRHRSNEEDASDEEDDASRRVAVRRHVSWYLAAWGLQLPDFLAVRRDRVHAEHKKLSRSALSRQNLANTRFYPTNHRYGHFKQPSPRFFNY